MAYFDQYTWIFGITVVTAFISAFGIGANDMANSFGTTLGSKALSLGSVVILAAICEFLGAILLGAGVTSTIKSGIADLNAFTNAPALLLFGFMCVSATSAIWDNLATTLSLPVSTTHTTVGATLGMALVLRGGSAVIWSQHIDTFPFIKGMLVIFLSWIVSPICSGIVSSVLFMALRTFVLRSNNGFQRAFWVLPILVGGMIWLIVAFIIQTGAKNATFAMRPDSFAAWVGAVCGIAAGLITLVGIMPILRRRINKAHDEITKLGIEHADDPASLEAALSAEQHDPEKAPWYWLTSRIPQGVKDNRVFRFVFWNFRQDIHACASEEGTATHIVHDRAEVFDARTEAMFRYLQVFSAGVMSFTHGANDVSNAMGPFSAVYQIWQTGQATSSVNVQTWILAVGGAGIVLGLALYSSNISRTLGVRVAKITYARGFSAELGTAITVAIASRYGLPVSTTQVITGALIAVGLTEGIRGVNWKECFKIFAGWVITILFACGICALFVALGVNSPNRRQTDDVITAQNALLNVTGNNMLDQMYQIANDNPTLNYLDTLNEDFYGVFNLQQASLAQCVNLTQVIFAEFNKTLAYDSYSMTPGTLVSALSG